MRKRWLSICLAVTLLAGSCCLSFATTLTKEKNERQKMQKELDEINENIDAMKEERESIVGQLGTMNEELVEMMLTIEVLEMDIETKQGEIEEASQAYEEAKKKEENQYQSMKKRIRFMYENGDYQYMTILLSAEDMGDLLNKSEYVQELHKADRALLTEYQNTKTEVAALKTQLEEEEDELLMLQSDLEYQKEDLEIRIAEARTEVSDMDKQLSEAKTKAKEYRVSIEKKNQKIQQLEEEERKRQEEESKKQESTANTGNSSNSSNTSGNTGGNVTVSGSGTGAAIAKYALQFVGNPYVYGGNSLTNGIDCSGFTQAVHAKYGISIPRSSVAQSKGGKSVALSEVQAGDVIYYGYHVGIYIGNGKIVHASSAKTGIKISSYVYRTPICVRRYW